MKQVRTFLFIIIALGAIIRFIAIYPGYNPYHPDEPTSYNTAIYINEHNYKPDRFDYPAGMALLHALVFRNVFMPISLLGLFITEPESVWHFLKLDPDTFDIYGRAIFGNRQINAMYWSRIISATIGALTVLLLYFTGKKLFNKYVGLFAAFFLAINYRHVVSSVLGLPDIINALLALLGLYTGALMLEKNTPKRYLFAGIACGLTFSIKYQPFLFLLPLLVHIIWTVRTKRLSYFFGKNAWIAATGAILSFLIVNPYYLPNIQNAFFRNRQDIGRYQMGVRAIRIYPYFYLFHWGIGRLPSILVALGALIMFFRERVKFLLMFAFAGSFLIFMTYFSNGGIFSRNFVTPMPYLMLFAGFGFYSICTFFTKISYKSGFIIVVFLLAINWHPIKNVFLLDAYYSKPWSVDNLADWFDRKLPENVRLRTYQLFMFMNPKGQDALKRKNTQVLDWDYSQGPNSLAEFSREGTDLAIMQIQQLQHVTYRWRVFSKQTSLLNYSEVPYDYILEGFYGLTLRELLPHTVAEFYKPWQAAAEFGFFVFKIPSPPLSLDRRIANFTFASPEDLWRALDPFDFSPMKPAWVEVGKNDSGSTKIPPGGGDDTTRLVSDPIAVDPEKHYSVSGWIKNITDKPELEDGYLRIDFYPDTDTKTLSMLSMDVGLSERATTSGEWSHVQANATSPRGARFMTISFQRQNPWFSYTSFLDNVEVHESTPAKEKLPELPVFRSSLQWRDAFFSSFL